MVDKIKTNSVKRVLITGGLGFIGSHLAKKYVEKGSNVSILSRSTKKIDNIKGVENKINLIIKDAKDLNQDDIKGVDYIFHFAGSVDNYSIKEDNPDRNPYIDIDNNCNTTIALLEACREYNQKTRIIFASTFFVNGNVEDLPVTPNSPCNPLGLYPATRLCAENFCHIYYNTFKLDIVIPRFCNVFGPFEQSNNMKKAGFNYLINLAIKRKDIPLYSNGEFFRDYIYVDDVVDGCMILADKGETNKIYYIGRGEFVKFKELINIVAKETGAKIKPIEPPEFHKQVGIVNFVCDNSDLKKLGWEPKVSLEEGIKKTIDYYKKNG